MNKIVLLPILIVAAFVSIKASSTTQELSAYPPYFSQDAEFAKRIYWNHRYNEFPNTVYMIVLHKAWTALTLPYSQGKKDLFVVLTTGKYFTFYAKATLGKSDTFDPGSRGPAPLVFLTKAQASKLMSDYAQQPNDRYVVLKIDTTKLAGTVSRRWFSDGFFGYPTYIDDRAFFRYTDRLVPGGLPLAAIEVLPFNEHQPIDPIDWEAE